MMGLTRDCKQYGYTAKIISNNRKEALMYQGTCLPLDLAKENLVRELATASFSKTQLPKDSGRTIKSCPPSALNNNRSRKKKIISPFIPISILTKISSNDR